MKRKFFIQIFSVALLFISSLSLFGQNSVRPLAKKLYEIKQHARSTGKFDKLFNESTQNSRSKAISEVVSNAQLLTLNSDNLAELIKGNNEVLELTIPFNGRPVTVEMFQKSVFSDGFTYQTSSTFDKKFTISGSKFYRGIVKGNENAIVAMSFFQ
ncbi:MAG: hypothetical protein IPL95_11280 [Saprospiraceae bacterium]|nr:hypothetical protein [Saprospiraceae bacterium]